ncbi:hypothetical protein BH11ARM2_BH11ARM2_37860 [soil metagenome]
MNRKRNIALSLVALIATGVAFAPTQADAQSRRPAPARQEWRVRPLVVRTERESNAFRDWFERSAWRREAGLKANVQRLDESLERLRAKATDNRPGVGRDELKTALDYGRAINTRISRRNNAKVVREWSDLRRTLNALARMYGLRAL